ncbi:hypothetical protein RGF97_14760 [Streptomyces roseicoloratus]|uniref:Uncharacterized protein n=1 Tax=Streptomyces roseicoloratus TaxID=2508722 RepID=A0ABY9RUK5_9ACTN|nr:hypothetical protein [Streptomyces roseicoloratus]WMX45866.1 hypothetical protein RGF97_14760 [Streptomyces roseicoloratus]
MTTSSAFTHPRWGLQFHWWAVDPSGQVGLFHSAFGPVPIAAHTHVAAMDSPTAQARASHPEWFDWICHDEPEDCPQTHCPVTLDRGPYLFTWDEETDDRYTRFGIPEKPLLAAELPRRMADAALLVETDFVFERTVRIDLSYPAGRELLSGSGLQRHGNTEPTDDVRPS